jgi:hypothetical protein
MTRRTTFTVGLTAAVAAAIMASLVLGTGQARSASGCTRVSGHLFDLHHIDPNVAVGRMVGGIEGSYQFTFGPLGGSDPAAPVLFGTADATITTRKGELRWHESNAYDYGNQDDYNNAILASVTGGTGAWAGASGHVILSGYFHAADNSGELDYVGAICTG